LTEANRSVRHNSQKQILDNELGFEGPLIMSAPLPEFKYPPINEVVMGIQMIPLRKLKIAHFGLY